MQSGLYPPLGLKTLPLWVEYLKVFRLDLNLIHHYHSLLIEKDSPLSLVAHHQYNEINQTH